MDYGNKTNDELLQLIAGGILAFGDTAHSISYNQKVRYNGMVWVTFCGCYFIGTIAICHDPSHSCKSVTDASGLIIGNTDSTLIYDYNMIDYSPFDYNTN